jgi:murein DD-endopeptidase MepM/ murein hydrolase activator NlpD
MKKQFLTVSTLLFLASCTQEPAPVIDKSKETYGLSAAARQLADDYNFTDSASSTVPSSSASAPVAVVEEESDFLPKQQIVNEANTAQQKDIQNSKIENDENDLGGMHIVEIQPGQTLNSIAEDNNVPLRTIIEANNLTPPYDVLTGQRIFIPKGEFHVVKTGETLFSISRDYGVDVTSLARTNEISGREVRVGETLQIPHRNLEETPEAPENQISGKLSVSEEVVAPIAVLGDVEQGPIAPGKTIKKISPAEAEKASTADDEKHIDVSETNAKPEAEEETIKISTSKVAEKDNVKVSFKDDGKFAWPVKGNIVKKFSGKNDGINIAANEGTKVRSAKVGEVVYAGNELKGYGNLVLVKHQDGYLTAYAHMKDIKVKKGDKVGKGTVVGDVGQTGKVKSPQLFFAIRKGKEATDPLKFLK